MSRTRQPQPVPNDPLRIPNGALGALEEQLKAFGRRSQSTLFSFRVRQARALLEPLVSAFYGERAAVLEAHVRKRDDGAFDIEPQGNGVVRFGFVEGKAEAGAAALTELLSTEVELPAGLPRFTIAMFDAAQIGATEPELEALGPLLDLAAP